MAELERPTIQLADASGPQPLSDESNYKFLQQIFDAKEKDPLAKKGYDVDSVFQILEGKKGYRTYGSYSPDIAKQSDTNLNKVEKNYLYKSDYEDLDRLNPKMSKANKGVIMMEPFNTEQGVLTLIHEFRHKAIDDDPVLKKIVDDSRFSEEMIVRAMDLKYFDDERTKEFIEKRYKKLNEYGQKLLLETVNKLEEASLPKKEEKEDPSFFSKLKEKLGFNQGGIADINYLTRRL
jgi:hypothetical protein